MTTTATHDAAATSGSRQDAAAGITRFETTRFGPIEVASDRIIHFAGGLLGFPRATRFALVQADVIDGLDPADAEDDDGAPCVFWLQNIDDAALAFVVCDPSAFVPDYDPSAVPLREECRAELGLSTDGSRDGEQVQVLAICNRVGEWLTGNLMGPLVVNVEAFCGKQVVLPEKRWGTRHPLLRLGQARDGAASPDTAGRIGPGEVPLRKTA